MDWQMELETMGKRAKAAARQLSTVSTEQKNKALLAMADRLVGEQARVLAANARDMAEGKAKGLSAALLDRLLLTPPRIDAMAEGLRQELQARSSGEASVVVAQGRHSGGAAGQGGGARDEALPWTLAAEDDVIGQALQVWQQQAEGLGADKG